MSCDLHVEGEDATLGQTSCFWQTRSLATAWAGVCIETPVFFGCHHVLTSSQFVEVLSESTFALATACAKVSDCSYILGKNNFSQILFRCYQFLLCVNQQWVKFITLGWANPNPREDLLRKPSFSHSHYKSLDPFQFYLVLLSECGWTCRKHVRSERNMALDNSQTRVILRCICRHLPTKYLRLEVSLQVRKLQICMDFQKLWLQFSIAPRSMVPGTKRETILKFKKHSPHVRADVLPTAGCHLSSTHPALHFGENKLELSVGRGAVVHWSVQGTWMKPSPAKTGQHTMCATAFLLELEPRSPSGLVLRFYNMTDQVLNWKLPPCALSGFGTS